MTIDLEGMRCHVDTGGNLSHRDALALLLYAKFLADELKAEQAKGRIRQLELTRLSRALAKASA